MRERAKPADWVRKGDAALGDAADTIPRANRLPVAKAIEEPRADEEVATADARRVRGRGAEANRHNPTYGLTYWVLGLAAAIPPLLCAVALLASAGVLPFVPQLPVGLTLGAVLVLLSVGAVFAHANDYPAWTLPGVGLLPILLLFLPAATLRGQVLTRVNGDPDRMVVAPLAVILLLLAAATIVCAVVAVVAGRFAPSFSGMALLPAPLILSWLILLAPPFEEREVISALGCALALTALTTFLGWLAPAMWRPAAPAIALGLQFILFAVLGVGLPAYSGAVRPMIALDIALFAALVMLVLFVPFCAAWLRHTGWSAVERLMG